MFVANLIEKSRLVRKFNVITREGVFEVVYDGRGMGFEEVIVDNKTASRIKSFWWYVPEFQFLIGNTSAKIEVGVSIALKIRRFDLIISGVNVYSE